MTEYVDVVTVNTPMYGKKLRVAPFRSGLKAGDKVMIEIEFNPWECQGIVEDIATYNTERNEFRLLRSFVGMGKDGSMELDQRVTKKLFYEKLWEDED